jgi:hypothetical protein
MSAGDHLRVARRLYWHHGIDMGDGTVIHASGEPGRRKLNAAVRRTTTAEFLRGGRAVVVNAPRRESAERITDRAVAAIGGRDYSLVFNNCEHFARWCESGEASSRQVDTYALAGAAAGVGARVLLGAATRRAGASLVLTVLPVAVPISTTVAIAGIAVAVRSRLRRPATLAAERRTSALSDPPS